MHPVFRHLAELPAPRPLVVAHRGDSRNHPENTLAAFRSASELRAPVQEFDVRQLGDGALVCVHDATFDRTTDAARVLGPGALLANATLATARRLDAGSWFGAAHAGEPVPTLAAALAAMLPHSVPMIEHKSGAATAFVAELRRGAALDRCIVQSFDWDFVAAVAAAAPGVALAVLGPTPAFPRPDAQAVRAARDLGAGMVHWCATEIGRADVARIHEQGMLVCTYTTDCELGWFGGAALGIDAMCTNDPGRMLATLASNQRV